ncbi:MAG: hypothetical protein D6820_08500, partial [Lentisphaerae bacterium]
LVSDTIIYSMSDRTPKIKQAPRMRNGKKVMASTGWERLIWVRFVGESREKTVLRLRAHAPGFGRGQEKAVIAFGKSGFNNRKGLNVVRNLTIEIEEGNPGAVGIDFTGANSASISNVTIRAAADSGLAGILIHRPPVLAYMADISIDGFDYGIWTRVGHATVPVFDHISITNPHRAGVRISDKREDDGGQGPPLLILRHLNYRGATPLAELTHPQGYLILTDSEARATSVQPALLERKSPHGTVLLQHVKIDGFQRLYSGGAVRNGNDMASDIAFLCISGAQEQALHRPSLLLQPFQEPPPLPWPDDPSQWTTPEAFGAKADGKTDDTAAFQRALNSGKPYLFLTGTGYHVSSPLQVPATVTMIDGMFRWNPQLHFIVSEASDRPLWLVDVFRGNLTIDAPRHVIRHMCQIGVSTTERARGGLLTLLGGSYPRSKKNPARIRVQGWAVNNEGKGLPIRIEDTKAWILGLKTERGPVLHLRDAQAQVLGTIIGVHTPERGAIVIESSRLLFSGLKSAGPWPGDIRPVSMIDSHGSRDILPEGSILNPDTNGKNRYFPVFPLFEADTTGDSAR